MGTVLTVGGNSSMMGQFPMQPFNSTAAHLNVTEGTQMFNHMDMEMRKSIEQATGIAFD